MINFLLQILTEDEEDEINSHLFGGASISLASKPRSLEGSQKMTQIPRLEFSERGQEEYKTAKKSAGRIGEEVKDDDYLTVTSGSFLEREG